MRLTLLDSRQLAVAVCLPAQDKFFNWATEGWETPFNATAHLLPITPMEAAPSPFNLVQSVDTGAVMERSDAVAIVCTTTGSGSGSTLALATLVDCLPGPPAELPARYAWKRN